MSSLCLEDLLSDDNGTLPPPPLETCKNPAFRRPKLTIMIPEEREILREGGMAILADYLPVSVICIIFYGGCPLPCHRKN
ncbi:hypothetical protein H0H93_004300 [Arthromyces matolae]|nr:hypothetical protein H0H93_004300 [Arthromyces matolae]